MIGRKRKYILLTYKLITKNEVDSLADIPDDVRAYFLSMPYLHLIMPFVKRDLIKYGLTLTQCSNKYQISYDEARGICRSVGKCKKKIKAKREIKPKAAKAV